MDYRILYRIKGHIDLKAEDEETALKEFESLTVKTILEKSNFEIIDIHKLEG
jgi:hypothetical protein